MLASFPTSFLQSPLHKPRVVATYTETSRRSSSSSSSRNSHPEMATAAASSSSLYQVLGIPTSASGNEIKAAYRKLARTCHPDVVAMNQKEMSSNQFMKIHAAYSTLSDPDKRANYDKDLFIQRKRPAAMASRFSGYTTRNWETDQCW